MKIAVLTSGGDAPGMNAAIRAVAKADGKSDQAGANLKQAGEKVKDAFKS